MAATVYEGMFIFDSGKYGRETEAVTGQVPAIIQEAGGEMMVSRLWEERRLAYPIKGQRKGTYWLTYFRIDGSKLSELNRAFQLSDSVLRHLFVKVDPRIVDTLVEHARTGQAGTAVDRRELAGDSGGEEHAAEPPKEGDKEAEEKAEAPEADSND